MDNKKRDLDAQYEETRQAWNAAETSEERANLSERLNEIRGEQLKDGEEGDDED